MPTWAKSYPYGKQTIRDGVAGDRGVRREGTGIGQEKEGRKVQTGEGR